MPTAGTPAGRRRPVRFAVPCLAVLLAAFAASGGCASATKRLEQGMELEERGRPADAAVRYADALKKDPSLTDARAGLQRTGDAAVHLALEASAAHEAAGRLEAASDEVIEVDRLRTRASEVGVTLAVPDDYAARRSSLFNRTIEAGLAEARAAVERQLWSAATARLDRLQGRWRLGAGQLEQATSIRFEAQTGWADAELRAGRFRSAYNHAGTALGLFPAGDPRGENAAAMREIALERGTLDVAVLPIAVLRGADSLPDGLLDDVEDDLVRRHWNQPEPFLRIVEDVRVLRAARHLLRSRDVPSQAEVTRLARTLDADLLVSVRVEQVLRSREPRDSVRRPVKTRTGQDTAFAVRTGREVLELRVAYEILAPDRYGYADRGTFSVRAADDYREGRFPGDWRQLELPRGDADLFSGAAATRTDERLAAELAERMAPTLAQAVFNSLRNQVP